MDICSEEGKFSLRKVILVEAGRVTAPCAQEKTVPGETSACVVATLTMAAPVYEETPATPITADAIIPTVVAVSPAAAVPPAMAVLVAKVPVVAATPLPTFEAALVAMLCKTCVLKKNNGLELVVHEKTLYRQKSYTIELTELLSCLFLLVLAAPLLR